MISQSRGREFDPNMSKILYLRIFGIGILHSHNSVRSPNKPPDSIGDSINESAAEINKLS